MSIFYTKKFYDRDFLRTSKSAEAVVPFLLARLSDADQAGSPVSSVIDIGCGRGVWLKTFADHGVDEIRGRDGPWTDQEHLLIDPSRFIATDLSRPLPTTERFDLAMTLEVAEHIDPPQADQFVANLAGLSDTIMFSAAIRGQGGQYHVNEQPLSFWVEKFARLGYQLYDVIRPQFWSNEDVCWWYRQNIVMFCNERSPYRGKLEQMAAAAPPIVDVSHPIGFYQKAQLANIFSPEEYVGRWVAKLKKRIVGNDSDIATSANVSSTP